jgi:hypothetical protein
VLPSLFLSQTAAAVRAALGAPSTGRVAVVDHPRLARLLAAEGRPVVQLAGQVLLLRRARGPRVIGDQAALPFADASLDAVVHAGRVEGEADLLEWRRVLVDRGVLVLIERAAPEELSRRVLCAGLVDLGQRLVGRTVITSGRVLQLPC